MANSPLAPVIKGLAAGIGLASEYRHHRKEQDAAKSSFTATESTVSADAFLLSTETERSRMTKQASTGSNSIQHGEALEIDVEVADTDEKQWHLDDAQDKLSSPTTDTPKTKTVRDPAKIAKLFTDAHPPTNLQHGGLHLPVVLPQRRPKNRTRGFIRAYAPDLQTCDIDQETFLQFIETFNTATLASPWLDAINLASFAFMALPTGISQAASIALAIAVDITKNVQSRHRHSYVLDQLNTEFFRPRGLYALILTWNPESTDMQVSVNLNETVAQNLAAPQNLLDKAKRSFRPSMGNTVGTAFSETAPLIFPVLDSLVNDQTPEAKDFKQKVKNAKGLMAEYFDRRAQAQHAGDHPDSQLAVTKPVFTSRYSDPNNATNSGDLVALVTGGKLSMPARGGRGGLLSRGGGLQRGGLLSQRMDMANGNRFQGRGFSRFQNQWSDNTTQQSWEYEQNSSQTHQRGVGGGPLGGLEGGVGGPTSLLQGGIKRVFQHHVLYLAIINMPSDEELATATELLKKAKFQS